MQPTRDDEEWLDRARHGVCNICGSAGTIEAPEDAGDLGGLPGLREWLRCSACSGISRDRALILALGGMLNERGPLSTWPPRPGARMFETSGYRGHPGYLTHLFDYFNLPYAPPPSDEDGEPIDARAGADVQDLQFPDEFFDVVMTAEVMEHVPDARAAIHELHRVLKPGGHLVLEAPYVHVWERTSVLVHRWHGRDVYLAPPSYHAEETLVYRVYGRELLSDLAAAGLAVAHLTFDVDELGISPQSVIVATKGPYVDLGGFRVGSWLGAE